MHRPFGRPHRDPRTRPGRSPPSGGRRSARSSRGRRARRRVAISTADRPVAERPPPRPVRRELVAAKRLKGRRTSDRRRPPLPPIATRPTRWPPPPAAPRRPTPTGMRRRSRIVDRCVDAQDLVLEERWTSPTGERLLTKRAVELELGDDVPDIDLHAPKAHPLPAEQGNGAVRTGRRRHAAAVRRGRSRLPTPQGFTYVGRYAVVAARGSAARRTPSTAGSSRSTPTCGAGAPTCSSSTRGPALGRRHAVRPRARRSASRSPCRRSGPPSWPSTSAAPRCASPDPTAGSSAWPARSPPTSCVAPRRHDHELEESRMNRSRRSPATSGATRAGTASPPCGSSRCWPCPIVQPTPSTLFTADQTAASDAGGPRGHVRRRPAAGRARGRRPVARRDGEPRHHRPAPRPPRAGDRQRPSRPALELVPPELLDLVFDAIPAFASPPLPDELAPLAAAIAPIAAYGLQRARPGRRRRGRGGAVGRRRAGRSGSFPTWRR